MRLRYMMFRILLDKKMDDFSLWIAWHLPKAVVKWAFVRVFSVASTGKFSFKGAGTITCFEASEAWDEQ